MKIQNHYFVVVLVSLLFTTYYVHFTRSYSFFSKYWTYYQTQLVPIWCHFITLCHSRFFFKTALFFHLQIKPKVKNLLAVVHFQKVFKEKFQRDIFLTTVQLQMHLLRMCKTRGAIFKLVCHDQSISGSQKTLWKTKQKLHFNTLSGGF